MDHVRSGRRNFDLLESALEKTNLIEASAGTGKTYAIAGIFLRLLLENRLSISEILVVTYTVAATEELRDRIRRTIRAAIDAFTKGEHEDPFLNSLVRKSWIPDQACPRMSLSGVRDDTEEVDSPALSTGKAYQVRKYTLSPPSPIKGEGKEEAGIQYERLEKLRILRAALRDFDEAPIYTIHGFCQRVLHENAFESMGLFDTELVPDARPLHSEIIYDFWRKHFYNAPRECVSYALKKRVTPRSFLTLIEGISAHSDMEVVPAAPPVSLTSLPLFRKARERVLTAWKGARGEILSLLKNTALRRTVYRNPDVLTARMDGYADSEETFPLFEGFEKFTASSLKAGTRKGALTPSHHFFDECEECLVRARELESQIEGHLLFLKADIFRYLQQELRKRKQARNIQFYDDLLLNLKEALERSGGKDLINKIRGRFRAALIDEFQDTDPIQYAIFHTLFGGGAGPLFLIGDPKQSIYSFRGADLFAYMRASRHVDFRYTLRCNWRSEPDLVSAVNAIFENPTREPFLYEEVPFERAAPGEVKDRNFLTVNGNAEPPFHFWYLDSDRLVRAGAKTNRSMTAALIARAVTAEIIRLITLGREGNAMIGTEPLAEHHIAVLVRENREARLVQESLRGAGIHSVVHSTGYLFDTHEAMEMERVLAALAEPHAERLMRIALTTDMLGLNGEALESLDRIDPAWEEWLARFRDYNGLWERYGFIGMFRHFLAREKVRERLLAFPDGERRLTNVLHLMEVLHTESIERRLGVSGTVTWLSCQRDPNALRLDEHELRLESDDRAVRIITIHKSKGLEYPVVFCPFNWGGSKIRKHEFSYHNPEDDWRLNLVLDPDAVFGKTLAERETLAENIRLLYVAVTRAKNRCYLVWGPFKDAETSSLAYVLHQSRGDSPSLMDATEENFSTLSDADFRNDLARIAAKSYGAISLCGMPDHTEETLSPPAKPAGPLACRTFSGIIDRDRRIGSFSYLRSERAALTAFTADDLSELPDRDGETTAAEMVYHEEPSGMYAFPRGANAGNCLHDILENVDFAAPDTPETKNLVAVKLIEHGFDLKLQETVLRMINIIVATPLDPAVHGLTFSAISVENRLSEIEFTFPLNRLTPELLQNIFRESGLWSPSAFPEKIGKLAFQPVHGYMKGFIDLVFLYEGRFFLVDWKSNFLGASVEDYRTEVLAEVMRENLYFLQYHLYIVALHQYLKTRLSGYDYKAHFGGVMYIFLRGVHPETGPHAGIYRDRPTKKTVEFLCKKLIAR